MQQNLIKHECLKKYKQTKTENIFNQYIQDAEVNESILSSSDLNENPEYYEYFEYLDTLNDSDLQKELIWLEEIGKAKKSGKNFIVNETFYEM